MAETEIHKKTDLDELLRLCCEDIDFDTTMGFQSTDSLTPEQKALEVLNERSKRVNALLSKMVSSQNRDDRHAPFLRIANKFCTKLGAAIAVGLLGGVTWLATLFFQAQFEKSPLEEKRDELMLQMLEAEYGPIDTPDQKK